MNRRIYSGAGLALVAVAFLVFTLLNNLVFGGVKLDLTEGKLYTLSDGSRKIIDSIDEPVNLYFFFSDKASEDLTSLRAYAQRVQELLQQYADLGHGKIKLQVVDPEPFSEEEDLASSFGLQSVPVNNGNELFFGLAGTNSLDSHEVIPFFQPDKEQFLEYDVSRLIQSLARPDKPVVGLMSSLKIQGDVDMQTFQTTPAWVIVDQLGQQFDIHNIEMTATAIPDDVDLLVIVHPKNLSEQTQFAIDQFAMGGGHVLVFLDPLAEQDRPNQQNPMMQSPVQQASDMDKLLSKWGVTMRKGVVLGDSQAALQVNGRAGRPVRHLAILGLEQDDFSKDDVITASLENINVSSAGILDIDKDATTDVTPLIRSSEYSMPIDAAQLQFLADPEELQRGFKPTGDRYVVAARLSGKASTAFPEGVEDVDGDVIKDTDHLNVIVVADTDLLSDRLWVRVQNFFGQRIASPWANNGDFVINAVDNLLGSSELISVRSRGRFTRPFDVVQDLRREAEARYLESANDLQAQLSETEQKLKELESKRTENHLLSLSPEQEAALENFQQQKLRIRKQLRDVRHQLDKDIEMLGTTLKFVDILVMPLLLTLMLLVVNYVRMRREGR